jgi:hypothetical protein
VAGTIKAIIGFHIDVIPEARPGLLTGLRCDIGWPGEHVVPVAVLADRPLDRLDVALTLPGGMVLDEKVGLSSGMPEVMGYNDRINRGEFVLADLSSGVHECLELRTDLVPGVEPNRSGPLLLEVTAVSGDSRIEQTIPFTGQFRSDRPPIWLLPRNEVEAYVSVPQLNGDSTVVWAFPTVEPGRGTDPRTCDPATRSAEGASTDWDNPRPIDAAFFDTPGYAWDTYYDWYTLWELELYPAQTYKLCVWWMHEQVTEEWLVRTPDGMRVDIIAGVLATELGSLAPGQLDIGTPGLGTCFSSLGDLPDRALPPGRAGYYGAVGEYVCSSVGPFAESAYLQALYPDRTYIDAQGVERPERGYVAGDLYLGRKKLETCIDTPPGATGWQACQYTLKWLQTNYLCGGEDDWHIVDMGDWGSGCDRPVQHALQIDVFVDELTAGRPGPMEWGLEFVERRQLSP